jgi:hypothetical protein
MGSILNANIVIPKTEKWICPAPRARGLRRKRQCGVLASYEEHLHNKIRNVAGKGLKRSVCVRPVLATIITVYQMNATLWIDWRSSHNAIYTLD